MTVPFRVGRYETMRLIASGGMAKVYLGRALGAGGFQRMVALKVMQPHLASDPHFVDMFLDEARLAARIHHPNVVATYDIEQQDGLLCLVMEYVEGASLQQLLSIHRERAPRLPLPVTLRIFLDALAGLHAAHDLAGPDGAPLHLVHRDVSPHNVLVGKDGIARITDFGVARAEERLSATRGEQLKGKIAFMAPEQLRSEAVDRRTDVYGAGCILWEMLAGSRLFDADNDGALVASVVAGATCSPRDVNPEVPHWIDEVCMRALEAREDRFPTAQAFATALEDAAAHSRVPIAAPRAVGELVTSLFPATDTLPPLGAMNLPRPPAVGVAPRWEATAQLGRGHALDSTRVGPPPMLPANHPYLQSSTSLVSSSALQDASVGRSRSGSGTRTLMVALLASVAGGAAVWMLMGGGRQLSGNLGELPAPAEPVAAAPATPAPAEEGPPVAPTSTQVVPSTPASSSSPSAAAASSSARPPKAAAPPRPRAKRSAAAPPTTAPPSPTNFRPDNP